MSLMSGETTLLEDLDAIVDVLALADVQASVDPADLNLPGVWVQVTGIAHDLLDGYSLNGQLLCIVGDQPTRAAIGALDELQNTVRTAAGHWVAGDTTAATAILPDTPTPMPALAIPYSVPCAYKEPTP